MERTAEESADDLCHVVVDTPTKDGRLKSKDSSDAVKDSSPPENKVSQFFFFSLL